MKKTYTYRNQIFIVLLLTNFLVLLTMACINYYQNSKSIRETKVKEIRNINTRIQETLNYALDANPNVSIGGDSLEALLSRRVFEFSSVYNVGISLYDLQGKLITSNRISDDYLPKELLQKLKNKLAVTQESKIEDGNTLYSTYSYIQRGEKIVGVLRSQKVLYLDSSEIMSSVAVRYYVLSVIFLSVISGAVAWFVSKRLTKKIQNISEKLENTSVASFHHPIEYKSDDEIKPLVNAYNNMLQKLKEQTRQMQKSEREEAWREMAKQVAHEINNPLTPLRLMTQNFRRKFRQEDPDNSSKVKALTESIIHQIDIISAITKSFSDFAKMPANKDTEIDIVATIRRCIDIFPSSVVAFTTDVEVLIFRIDTLYFTRVITNIVKNGIQAGQGNSRLHIHIHLEDHEEHFKISISDNGCGIAPHLTEHIFDKDFTTKSTGMGLGLSMVKSIVEDYGGRIWFDTKEGEGTTFYISFRK